MRTISLAAGLLAAWLALSSGLGWAQQGGPPAIVGAGVDGVTAGTSPSPRLVPAEPVGPSFAPGPAFLPGGVPSGGAIYAGSADGYYADPFGNPVEYGPPPHYYYVAFPRSWTAYAEYLNWAAHRDGLDVAVIGDFNAVNPNLRIAEAQLGRDSGVRFGLGYQFASRWEFDWNYTYFSTNGSLPLTASVVAPVTTTQVLFFPSFTVTTGDFTFTSQLRYHVHDLEFTRWILIDDFVGLRMFCGFRWAMIDQQLSQTYQNTPRALGPASVSSVGTLNMDAYGLRFGSEGRWKLPGGWSVFGKGSASVLSGHFSNEVNETASFVNPNGVVTTFTGVFTDNTTQVVPVLEVAAGVAWTGNRFELSLGYELAAWLNMANASTALNPVSANLLLDGFFVRAAFIR